MVCRTFLKFLYVRGRNIQLNRAEQFMRGTVPMWRSTLAPSRATLLVGYVDHAPPFCKPERALKILSFIEKCELSILPIASQPLQTIVYLSRCDTAAVGLSPLPLLTNSGTAVIRSLEHLASPHLIAFHSTNSFDQFPLVSALGLREDNLLFFKFT